ncbi:hypothetical protein CAPTEDRAFT_184916 [Capitella teleta]|uniref:Uncharacterized protein n=1 Tax=Capitella teleta TaxID=283909 RepID=X1ZH85_CAPTE|nr:hypothetical protein CAPTEDRAFT_184916 [Capitella teleta]|eukprot:ELT90130.1 hypothetical protein CAPTEDRAFT_184916 [Capitella teleta]
MYHTHRMRLDIHVDLRVQKITVIMRNSCASIPVAVGRHKMNIGGLDSTDRVKLIRRQFDLQRQQWDSQVKLRSLTHQNSNKRNSLESISSDESDSDTEKEETRETQKPALRLVASNHVVSHTGTTFFVTYDIRDFVKNGSVEVHCDPDGIVVTALLSTSPPERTQQTFLIANVDHSSLRVKSSANGLMEIAVSSKKSSQMLWKHCDEICL